MAPLTDLEGLLTRLGVHPPGWLITVVLVLLIAAVARVVLAPLASVLRYGWTLVRWLAGRRYSTERRRQRRRSKLSTHLDNQLVALELQEDWLDDKYAELEAEVEIERTGRWQRFPFRQPSLRRERSLSKALEGGSEPLLLLEGEPGAGKSVALRHLARKLARRAARSGDPRRTIPLYLNLKSLDIPPEEVSADRIRQFVLDTLTEVNNRDVAEVLDEEWERGLEDGTWLFLFDSFDEIPDILSAQDVRAVIPAYAKAIADFLAFTNCRGVVASRDFSSPDTLRFTRCRILRLSRKHQLTLIRRADLEPDVDRAMREGLTSASQDIATFAANPMFLGLLCEHMRTAHSFPTSSHAVFEQYLTHRLHRDVDRIRSRFGVEVDFVRSGAEEIAFTMTATTRMGLEPPRSAIRPAVAAFDRLGPSAVDKLFDVLEYTKLGRGGTNSRGEVTFSFIHRRFQEYFATCMAIRDHTRVGTAELLTEDLWRETAVTLLQVQDKEASAPLLAEATERLRAQVAELDPERFHWPAGSRHLLGILNAGLESRPDAVTTELRGLMSKLVEPAWEKGHRLDRRHALRYATLADPALTERLLMEAFAADNRYLRQMAFQVAGRLTTISEQLHTQIKHAVTAQTIMTSMLFLGGSVRAEVWRLRQPAPYLRLIRLLRVAVPTIGVLPAVLCLIPMLEHVPDIFSGDPARAGATASMLTGLIVAFAPIAILICVATLYLPVRALVASAEDRPASRWSGFRVSLMRSTAVYAVAVVAIVMVWSGPTVLMIVLLVLCGFAAVLPPSLLWTALSDHPAPPVLLPVLPVLFVVAGLRGQLRWPTASPVSHPSPSPLLPSPDRRERVEMAGLAVLAAPVLAVGGLVGLLGEPLTAVGLVAMSVWVIPALTTIARKQLMRRLADQAVTAQDVLAGFARAWDVQEFDTLVTRFIHRQITHAPEVRAAVENLVGEAEQAKRGRPGEPLRTACPSLAARPVERARLLDTYPLRWMSTLHVRYLREASLDDLARLAEQE
jgi:NACHT domain